MNGSILVRTGSGQCQVVQEKGNAELQFSVFVSVSLALLQTNVYGIFWRRYFPAISEAEKSEPSILGQEIIDIIDLSSWRGQESTQF